VLTTPPEKTPSPNNLVRKYLRSIERSRPIAKAIEESRDSYGEVMSSASGQSAAIGEEQGPLVRAKGIKRKKDSAAATSEPPQTDPEKCANLIQTIIQHINSSLSFRSGWRIGKEGKWEKDPDAEFESDENPDN